MWHVLDMTHFSFRTRAGMCALDKIDDVESLVQSTRVCTRRVAEARMHVRYVHAKSGGLRAPWHVSEL